MKYKFRYKSVWVCLFAMAVSLMSPFSLCASANEVKRGAKLLDTAGQYGYYSYDLETGEETYVPASEYAPDLDDSEDPVVIPSHPASPEVLQNELTEYYENDYPGIDQEAPDVTPGVKAPRVVIPPDDRRAVYSTGYEQYSSTCLIVARFANGEKEYGTGFLVDGYHVLTAGHVVYTADDGKAIRCAVYAGSNNGTYKKYSLSHVIELGGHYKDNCDSETAYFNRGMYDDWAILECENYMGGVGSMGVIAVNNGWDVYGEEFSSQGYPRDLNEPDFGYGGNTEYIRYRMYACSGTVQGDGGEPQTRYLDLATIDIDLAPGQSGSPVYRNIGGDYYASAIMVAENQGQLYNYAILITDWLANAINRL